MSLTVKDLTKRYGDRTVVDRLSFEMPGPGVYALLGTNGAGKTTSIRMMLNMLSRDGGAGPVPQVCADGSAAVLRGPAGRAPGGGQAPHPLLGGAPGGDGIPLPQRGKA